MTKFKIYQINRELDNDMLMFREYEFTKKFGGVNPSIYDMVYSDIVVDDLTLDDIYYIFNMDRPCTYTGRSLSVSDVVYLETEGKYYFCDSFGWKDVTAEFNRVEHKEAANGLD